MTKYQVDLDVSVIPDDHGVWKLFPGESYKFSQLVRDHHIAFLDIRGLEDLGIDPKSWDKQAALQIIAADRWTRELERDRTKGPQGSPAVGKTDRRYLTYLVGLLSEARKGDLIVVPGGGYDKDVLIGQILDEPGEGSFTNPIGESQSRYPGRRVKWLPTQQKRHFSTELIRLIHSSTAFHTIGTNRREEIYRLAFRNFVLGDNFTATFDTKKQHFSTSDSAIISAWFNGLAAVRDAVELGETLREDTFWELALLHAQSAEEGELSININSPGQFILKSVGVFALVVMALTATAGEVSAKEIVSNPPTVTLQTIGSADSSCALKVDAAIASYVSTLTYKRTVQACDLAIRAKQEATLTTNAELTAKKPPQPKVRLNKTRKGTK